jgi:hypothetical protein
VRYSACVCIKFGDQIELNGGVGERCPVVLRTYVSGTVEEGMTVTTAERRAGDGVSLYAPRWVFNLTEDSSSSPSLFVPGPLGSS